MSTFPSSDYGCTFVLSYETVYLEIAVCGEITLLTRLTPTASTSKSIATATMHNPHHYIYHG